MSAGTRVNRGEWALGCENIKEGHKIAGKYHHEICRSILKDSVESGLQTMSADGAAMSDRIYHDGEGRIIFGEEGLAPATQRLRRGKKSTAR